MDKLKLLIKLDQLKADLYNKWKGTFMEPAVREQISELEKELERNNTNE